MIAHTSVVGRLTAFGSGLAAVLWLHAVYGWWLNAGRDVLRTSLVLLVVSAIAAVWDRTTPWDRAPALWLGAVSGSTISLFQVGPGTIWPIVLASAAVIAASAILLGTLLGTATIRLKR